MCLDAPERSIGEIITVKRFMDSVLRYRVVSWRCPQPGEHYLDREGIVRFETGRFETMFNSDKLDPKSKRYIVREILGECKDDGTS